MQNKLKSLGRLISIMDELREKCPWDREQTMETLRNNTIEECFELTDAIIGGDMDEVRKELGDVLLHVIFYSKIAEGQGLFDISDVANSISEKLIYRHPHVFSTEEVSSSKEVSENWEMLKQKEKNGNKTILSGVPKGLPSLTKACRVQEKVSNVGFDWDKKEDVWAKVKEEIAEVEVEMRAQNHEKLEQEFGDLMFSLINAARLYDVNPDAALEKTNQKFIRRFNYLEQQTIKKGRSLKELSLQEMDIIWNQAKSLENK